MGGGGVKREKREERREKREERREKREERREKREERRSLYRDLRVVRIEIEYICVLYPRVTSIITSRKNIVVVV
jgi:hypothetical protein